MLPAFVASEDDARHVSRGRFMHRSVHSRDLLAPHAQFPSQVSSPAHRLSLLSFAHAEHLPEPPLQRRFLGALAASVQPVFKILDLDDMRDLGIPDSHGDLRQSATYVADPVVPAHHGERLRNRFVQRLRRHVELMRDIVQIVDNDGAGFGSHDGNLSYSLFVRLQSLI
jgi:hypothetical protein